MTEKRKRGRPPGSGKKKEVVGPFNPDKLSAEVKEVFDAPKNDTMADEHPMYQEVSADDLKLYNDFVYRPVADLPPNWNEMSKVDRLKWLTANRHK